MSASPLHDVLKRLEGVQGAEKVFSALCPAHDDREASLSVAEGEDGRVLLRCHAGCGQEDVVKALGLDFADLFPPKGDREAPAALTVPTLARQKGLPEEFLRRLGVREEGRNLRIPYRRRGGSEARPQFRRPDGKHFWGKRDAGPILPYGLDRIGGAEECCLVEGCSDVWTLVFHGFPALGLPGADMARKLEVEHVGGLRRLYLIREADRGGDRFERGVVARLRELGYGGEVRLVDMAPTGANDPNDLYLRDRAGFRDAWGRLMAVAPTIDLRDGEPDAPAIAGRFTTISMGELLSQVFEATEYRVDGMLPVGGISLLVAKPKAGKSTLARCLALSIATGADFLGRRCRKGSVLYAALEESLASVQAHFRQLGATGAEPIHVTVGHTPEDAVRALKATVTTLRPALVVVDPLVLLTRIRDASAYAEVYRALDPLIGLARETGAHVLLLHHSAKMERGGIDSPLGSTAFAGAVDTLLHLKRREDGKRLLSSVQRNGEDLPETVLDMDEGSGAVTVAGSYAELRLQETVDEMRDALRSVDEPLTRQELFERVQAAGKLKNDALKTLKDAGEINEEGSGLRGEPKRYSPREADSAPARDQSADSASAASERLFSCSDHRERTGESESATPSPVGRDELPPPEAVVLTPTLGVSKPDAPPASCGSDDTDT